MILIWHWIFLTESLKPVHKSIWSDSLANHSVFKWFLGKQSYSQTSVLCCSQWFLSVCVHVCVFDVLRISCMLGNLQCTYPWSIYHLSVSSAWMKTHYSSKRSGHCLRKNSLLLRCRWREISALWRVYINLDLYCSVYI